MYSAKLNVRAMDLDISAWITGISLAASKKRLSSSPPEEAYVTSMDAMDSSRPPPVITGMSRGQSVPVRGSRMTSSTFSSSFIRKV